jgi:uncharacterized protein (DUF1800 family)
MHFARAAAALVLAAAAAPFASPSPLHAQTAAARTPLDERERAVHLLSRATYGVRPQDVERVVRIGPTAWVEEQLNPEALEPELPKAGPSSATITFMSPPDTTSAEAEQRPRRTLRITLGDQGTNPAFANKLVRAIRSERQLEQLMTDFWLNHFSVYDGKREVARVVADYEETIRRNAFGKFRDLLGDVARHPAMLIYLDNYLNGVVEPAGLNGPPPSPGGSINENYARELLELHTLGVDGGYTQQDVTEVARAFTGWSVPVLRSALGVLPGAISPATGPLTFEFRDDWHDRGDKVVLGSTLPAGRGVEDGEAVLDLLARHPATAGHIATKLVRHFVAEDPPAELVEELARLFLDTDGDLRAVTRALFTGERFYAPMHYRAKVKRPYEFVVSALRVTDAELGPTGTLTLQSQLGAMRHAPYHEPAPTGYPVTAEAWLGSGAMLARMNFALEMSQGALEYLATISAQGRALKVETPDEPAVHIDPWAVLTGAKRPEDAPPEVFGGFGAGGLSIQVMGLLERMAPGMPSERLQTTITEDLMGEQAGTDPEALLRRAIALTLGSPEFQRY